VTAVWLRIVYLGSMCLAGLLSVSAYRIVYVDVLQRALHLSDQAAFATTFFITLSILFSGLLLENKVIWKGFFDGKEGDSAPRSSVPPAPIVLGAAVGVMTALYL
jgi:hypothetical protein